jgi:hypothetical protein
VAEATSLCPPSGDDSPPELMADPNVRWAVAHVVDSLRGLRFGVVTLTVQDGVVVQVERSERRRYRRAGESAADRKSAS